MQRERGGRVSEYMWMYACVHSLAQYNAIYIFLNLKRVKSSDETKSVMIFHAEIIMTI